MLARVAGGQATGCRALGTSVMTWWFQSATSSGARLYSAYFCELHSTISIDSILVRDSVTVWVRGSRDPMLNQNKHLHDMHVIEELFHSPPSDNPTSIR